MRTTQTTLPFPTVKRNVKTGSIGATLLAILVAMLAALNGRRDRPGQPPPRDPPVVQAPPRTAQTTAGERSGIGFRSRAALEDHFDKHGHEFGPRTTVEQYLRLAQALRDVPPGGAVVEFVRDDGVITRFDRSRGAFGAYNRDGTIRTFFRPNDGEAYFRRQAERGSEP
jgi:hypothetical protein